MSRWTRKSLVRVGLVGLALAAAACSGESPTGPARSAVDAAARLSRKRQTDCPASVDESPDARPSCAQQPSGRSGYLVAAGRQ